MGWRQLRTWRREMVRSLDAKRGRDKPDPDSWAGSENDAWRQEMLRKNKESRGF